jgi:hypothetical protein
MRNLILVLLTFTLCSCSEIEPEPSNYEITIEPSNPTSNDEIQFIHTHCKYEAFRSIDLIQSTFFYNTQFNSSILGLCILTKDTLLIGKLPIGIYLIKYELIDISEETLSSDSVYYTEELSFEVK